MTDSFGEYLRARRKQSKRTQRQLAREVGVDFTYLSKVENDTPGFSSLSEETLVRLADALQVDPDEMVTRAGKVPSDVKRMLIDDFSLIKELRSRKAGDPAGGDR